MLESLRRHTSLIVAVGAVAVLAASQVTAQEGAPKPGAAAPAAGIDADTVDGRHAVGAAATLTERTGKLVATNAQGYLPANIVRKAQDADKLDGLDSSIFARAAALRSAAGAVNEADNPVHWNQLKGVSSTFEDGKVGWGEVVNTPAGFADGNDDEGLTGLTITYVTGPWTTAAPGTWVGTVASCPAGSVAVGGGALTSSRTMHLTDAFPDSDGIVAWYQVAFHNTGNTAEDFAARAACLATSPDGGVIVASKGAAPARLKGR